MQNQIFKINSFHFPQIKADFALSLGSHCRVAHHLRKNHLRVLACPLDWMINDKLEVVWDLFRSDFRDFFRSCSIIKQETPKLLRVKDNHNDMISLHYFFINEDLNTQAKKINTQAIQRWSIVKDKILTSTNVVFIRSGNFNLKILSEFLKNISKLFGDKCGGGGVLPHQC